MAKKRKPRMYLRPATKYVPGGSKMTDLVEEFQRQMELKYVDKVGASVKIMGYKGRAGSTYACFTRKKGAAVRGVDDPGGPVRIVITPYLLQKLQGGRLGDYVEKIILEQSASEVTGRRQEGKHIYLKINPENENSKKSR